MQRDGLRLNTSPPVDVKTGTFTDGQYLQYDATSRTIKGSTPASGGLSQAQILTLVSYRG